MDLAMAAITTVLMFVTSIVIHVGFDETCEAIAGPQR